METEGEARGKWAQRAHIAPPQHRRTAPHACPTPPLPHCITPPPPTTPPPPHLWVGLVGACLLGVKWVHLALHQHVGQHQVLEALHTPAAARLLGRVGSRGAAGGRRDVRWQHGLAVCSQQLT